MAFSSVSDKAAAYELCQRAVNALCEPKAIKEHALDRYRFHHWYTFGNQRPSDDILNIWTLSVFQVRFVYWPKQNLVALVGEYPKAVEELFGCQVLFQNGCDQNYEMEIWDDNIPLFKEVKTAVSQMTFTEIQKALDWDDDDTTNDPEHADYNLKTLVYKRIFDALDLDNWLYGNDGQFERICMSGLTSEEKIMDVQLRVKHAIDHPQKIN